MATDINALIQEISDIITGTCSFTRWGGLCVHKSEKALPYGIGISGDYKGNTYSYDDKEAATGYMYISNLYTEEKFKNIPVEYLEITIYLFVSTKECGGNRLASYNRSIAILTALRNKYGNMFANLFLPKYEKYGFQEISYITLKVPFPYDCSAVAGNCDPVVIGSVVISRCNLRFHIKGTDVYDPLNPLDGWTQPASFEGNSAIVQFTDGVTVFYTYNTAWQYDFEIENTPEYENVTFDIQETGDYHPGAGIVRVDDNTGKYCEFTHYQYGGTIRTNYNIFEFFIGNSPTDYGTLSVRRNNAGNTAYGARIQARDRDDAGGLELSAATMHNGTSHLLVDYGYNGGIFSINNSQPNSIIKLICDTVESLIINKVGIQIKSYTTAQRDLLTGLISGTSIFNTTKNTIETWNGTVWASNDLSYTNGHLLGLGIETAKAKFHVFSSGSAGINAYAGTLAIFQNSAVNNNSYIIIAAAYNREGGIIFTDEGEGYKGKIAYDNVSEDMYFKTNNVENLRLNSLGELKIKKSISFTDTKNVDGSEVDNGNLFKGSDGALYFKGGSGTVTKIANA